MNKRQAEYESRKKVKAEQKRTYDHTKAEKARAEAVLAAPSHVHTFKERNRAMIILKRLRKGQPLKTSTS